MKIQESQMLSGNYEKKEVWLNGKKLSPAISQAIVNHSPDGFNWGYGGSGPSQLALAICLELTGKADKYMEVKERIISRLPKSDFNAQFIIPPDKCMNPSKEVEVRMFKLKDLNEKLPYIRQSFYHTVVKNKASGCFYEKTSECIDISENIICLDESKYEQEKEDAVFIYLKLKKQ